MFFAVTKSGTGTWGLGLGLGDVGLGDVGLGDVGLEDVGLGDVDVQLVIQKIFVCIGQAFPDNGIDL